MTIYIVDFFQTIYIKYQKYLNSYIKKVFQVYYLLHTFRNKTTLKLNQHLLSKNKYIRLSKSITDGTISSE
jgi:hypothetical protein